MAGDYGSRLAIRGRVRRWTGAVFRVWRVRSGVELGWMVQEKEHQTIDVEADVNEGTLRIWVLSTRGTGGGFFRLAKK